jgi:hypothetical protein
MVVIPVETLDVIDSVLAEMADALERGTDLTAEILEQLKGLACLTRAIVLEDRESGTAAWAVFERAAGR